MLVSVDTDMLCIDGSNMNENILTGVGFKYSPILWNEWQ
jgi:hypothetical protein